LQQKLQESIDYIKHPELILLTNKEQLNMARYGHSVIETKSHLSYMQINP
jgi:hypothetical protein